MVLVSTENMPTVYLPEGSQREQSSALDMPTSTQCQNVLLVLRVEIEI